MQFALTQLVMLNAAVSLVMIKMKQVDYAMMLMNANSTRTIAEKIRSALILTEVMTAVVKTDSKKIKKTIKQYVRI